VQFRVLGPLEVDAGDGPIPLGGPKQRAVLANLLIRANQVVPADALIHEVWGDEPPEKARNTLQTYVSNLRRSIGDGRLEGRSPGYVLLVEPSELDAARFDALVRDAKRALPVDPDVAVATLDDALAMWRGPALADLSDQQSLLADAARLDELRNEAQEDRIEGLLASGSHVGAIGELETLLARNPLRERLWGQLMLALYREGRQAEALGAFQRAREILADELGIDPSPDLTRLHQRVLKQDPGLELRGEPLRGYRLLEKIGEGPTGIVFRAIQPHVDRDVAVKVFHERIAADPAFVRRFEPEARLAAALEHPHIAPMYDDWREPGRAYVVTRYLRGGSLRALEDRGEALDRERAARVVEQVASALAFAHRQGVAHGSVCPSNVLFDADGNAYLNDFRIGTIPPADPAEDVRALARLARSILAGATSEVISDTIERAETDPLALGAEAISAAVRRAGEGQAPRAGDERNPYKGLRPFTEADARDFFGRTALVKRIVAGLNQVGPSSRFLAVVGPSGCGKSSLIRAGVVPAVRGGALVGAGDVSIAEMFPGTHPFDELESALVQIAVRPAARLHDRLESGSRGLLEAVDLVVPGDAEVMLVVDQFEEVFTLAVDDRERELFLESLRVATADPASRLRVIVTLRADFYDRPLAYPRFGELLAERTEAIPPLTPDEMEQAIQRPADQVGVRPEPGLVAEMVADVAHQPGALPLLQYALTELYERRDEDRLTLSAYRRLGGVGGALSARADGLYRAADPGERQAIRQLFLRLVTLGEGRQDTRRRVARSELDTLEVDQLALEAGLDAFGRHRLLTFDREPATREPTVEIAHESLLTAWDQLRSWIDDAREDLRQNRRLARAAAEWNGSERDPSFLMRGVRLEQVEAWAGGVDLALGHPERAYVKVSVDQRERERKDEQARRDHEARIERRSVRRLRSLVAVFAIAALIAGSLTVIATNQGERAETESRIARARELAAASIANLEIDAQRSLLLAIEAVELTRSVDGSVLSEVEDALHRAVVASRIVSSIPGVEIGGYEPVLRGTTLDWGPWGLFVTTRVFAAEGPRPGGVIDLRDPETGSIVQTLPGHDGRLTGAAFNADGSMLATTGTDGALKIWQLPSGDLLKSVSGDGPLALGPSFSADGSLVAAAWGALSHPRGSVQVVGLGTDERMTFPAPPYVNDAELSPDGRTIAAVGGAAPGDLSLIDIENGTIVRLKGQGTNGFTAVSWRPDGRYVAAGGWDSSVPVWDATGSLRFVLRGHAGPAHRLAWSPDSSRLVTGSDDGTARVWEITDFGATQVQLLSVQEGRLTGVVFSPDGTRVLTGTQESALSIWDVGPTGDAEVANIPNAAGDVLFASSGQIVLASGLDGSLTELNVDTREQSHTLGSFPPSDALHRSDQLNPDGAAVAIVEDVDGFGSAPSSLVFRDVATGSELFAPPVDPVSADWSPDGRFVAVATRESVWILDRTWRTVARFERDALIVLEVGFGPDGLVAIAGDHSDDPNDARIHVWDWRRDEVVTEIETHTELIFWDQSGARIGTEDAIWNAVTGDLVVSFPASLPLEALAFSPDGSRFATGGGDGIVHLFDAAGEQLLTLYGHDAVDRLVFSPDGMMLASQGNDGIVRIWALEIDDLLAIARDEVTRSLTGQECRTYLHLEACPA
jgi:WD40 repeat protein/DNA-binding SARP family transcriptional activator/tRNA A-37 threonylcarbamoyl transferase component Bud32